MEGFSKQKIGSLGRVITGKTPKTARKDFFGGDFPFITIPDLNGRVIIDASARTLSRAGANSICSSKLPSGAVMMSCIATVGRCGITNRTSFTNQQINSVIPNKNVNSFYLYYAFKQIGDSLERFGGGGSVYTNVSKNRFADIEIPVPSLTKQHEIVSILGALDDKIDLNRQMNKTLEAIARALFKDWFVDFGPTRAKMEGREPYLTQEIWNLFPDKLDDERKPEEWEISSIGNEVHVVGGATPSTKESKFWNGKINWVTPKDLSPLASPVLIKTARKITKAGLAKIGSGLLPVGTVLLSSRAPIGYIAVSEIPTAINQGFIGMVCENRISNVFAWLWTLENMEIILSKAGGTTFQEINKRNFRPIPLTVPEMSVIKIFGAIANPIYQRIAQNEWENSSLAQTRDMLLPKLISGKLKIDDAEKTLEKAGV